MTGMVFDPPGVCVNRMIEAVAVMKGLWRGDDGSFAGTHYTINGVADPVRPIQQPHPPILVGGGGKRLLSFAAREADIVGLLAKASLHGSLELGGGEMEDALVCKVGWIREVAAERFEHLELAMIVWNVTLIDHRQAAAEQMAKTFPAIMGG